LRGNEDMADRRSSRGKSELGNVGKLKGGLPQKGRSKLFGATTRTNRSYVCRNVGVLTGPGWERCQRKGGKLNGVKV